VKGDNLVIKKFLRALDRISPPKVVYAHCDIPCGIYDPHLAQVAAHTVIRMVTLIEELPKLKPDAPQEEREQLIHKLSRYTAIKEQHAELCKHEIRILWGDYFKPEHVQKFPELSDLIWRTLKQASKAKQEMSLKEAEELLENVNKVAEIFWKTKGVEVVKKKSFYPTERQMVYPKL